MSEWREVKLGEICDYVNRGITPRYVENNGKIILNQKCIRNGNINYTFAKMTSASKNYVEEKKLLEGDILINSTGVGTAGRVSIFDKKDTTYVDSHVSIVRLNSKISHSKFIFYNLFGREKEIENYAEGSTGQIELGREKIKDIDLNLPPLSEQKAIASVLSSLDDKIDLLHRQNETLEKMAETLFRQWFVEEAKEDWEEVALDDVIELIGGGTPKTNVVEFWNGDIPWLSGGDITSNHKKFAIKTEKNISNDGLEQSSTKLLPKFCTVISARGTVGKYCLLSKPMTFSQSNYGIKPKFHHCYFFSYLLVSHCIEELQFAAYGSVFDTITKNTFKGVKIKLPQSEIVYKFEKEIELFFIKILNNQQQIDTLTKLRDTLLPKLMSGEVRIEN